MCYGDDAHPPLPPVRGGADDRGPTVVTSADGTEVDAFFAHPDEPSTKGMVVLPDVRGLHGFYKELAVRFAEAGFHAIAIDYFARTAGRGDRSEEFPFMDHVKQLQADTLAADVAAGVGWLRDLPGADVQSIYTVGFCMGGSISWNASAAGLDVAGCIGFYGVPSRVTADPGDLKAPLLLLAAGQDFTPVEEVEKFAARVNEAGGSAEVHVYPDAPHSFFDRSFDQHGAACDDAWQRILTFTS